MPDLTSTALCFGEILWDCLPRGLFLGGAPANVAYHLQKFGIPALPVTSVGNDFLGEEIVRRLKSLGLDTQFVTTVAGKQTGVVLVDMTDSSHPVYDIVPDVAWDAIPTSPALTQAARTADALVYGTLALRGAHNFAVLNDLLTHAPGLKALDVNLRPPFVNEERLWKVLRQADLIKLNADELQTLMPGKAERGIEQQAAILADRTNCGHICVTCGAQGAGFWRDGTWTWCEARPIAVRDAVGAGDAFLAALMAGLLHGATDMQDLLCRACRLAEFVAQQDGATPSYDAMAFTRTAY